jgi:ABC-type polysaccharide/polyol phosphate transport system ATPase subunit
MVNRLEEIGAWSDLNEHLDISLCANMSGMVAHLAFATATNVIPDLLLIDEILSMGVAKFLEIEV